PLPAERDANRVPLIADRLRSVLLAERIDDLKHDPLGADAAKFHEWVWQILGLRRRGHADGVDFIRAGNEVEIAHAELVRRVEIGQGELVLAGHEQELAFARDGLARLGAYAVENAI